MIRVELDGGRSYAVDVRPGGLEPLGAASAGVLPPGRCVLVTNPVVGALYAEPAMASLRGAGFEPVRVDVPDGEEHKTVETWARLVDALLDVGVDRRTPVIALGGGVTGDIAGFAAATTLRGLPWVQVPTTLLAMVDASVGGKTGVNTRHGKNLVGAFHQPRLVFAALGTLDTLEPADYRAGLAEVVKHGLLGDPEIFRICEEEAAAVRARDPERLRELVLRSCAVKAQVVAADEREAGLRVVLNLGHTAGHAVETAAGHGRLRHGECVAIGLVAEARWAAARGACPPELPGRVEAVLAGLGLPVRAPRLSRERLEAAARRDKKRSRGTLRTAILVDVGEVRTAAVGAEELAGMLRAIPMEG